MHETIFHEIYIDTCAHMRLYVVFLSYLHIEKKNLTSHTPIKLPDEYLQCHDGVSVCDWRFVLQ